MAVEDHDNTVEGLVVDMGANRIKPSLGVPPNPDYSYSFPYPGCRYVL
jgi:hypothetical protein